MKEATGQEPKKSIKELIYELRRNSIKKQLTRNLGKVVEEEDRLVCYIEKNKIKKDKDTYTIGCFGMMTRDKILSSYYKLDKPIVYIIDGYYFEKKEIFIFGYNDCEVIIKNCQFDSYLILRINGKCTLENITIKSFSGLSISATNLIIKNINIIKQLPDKIKYFKSFIGADKKIEINNSIIGDSNSNIEISAGNQLEVYNSTIKGTNVICKTKKAIFGKKSSIISRDKTQLEIPDFYEINITSPDIIINGHNFKTNNQPVILRKIIDQVKLKRLELIQYLKNLKSEVESKNEHDLQKYQTTLSNKPISKILTK